MPKPSVRPYQWLAEYYDRMFASHVPWFEAARHKVIGTALPEIRSACDLCCGTGRTAIRLAKLGTRMYAVDVSPGMCRAARAKVKASGLDIRVIQADMRSFELPETVDLVISECDAINHVPDKSDLARVAKSVAHALRTDGYFFFDLNNRASFDTVWHSTWWIDQGDVTLVMHGGSEGDRAWVDVNWFIREGKLWKRRKEHVEEVCWTAAEVKTALRDAGFNRIRTFDAAPFLTDGMTRPGDRTFYLARKAH